MVPQLEGLVFGDEALLSFITDSFQFMARAMMPFVMLVLGGMLAEGPEESRLGLRTTVWDHLLQGFCCFLCLGLECQFWPINGDY